MTSFNAIPMHCCYTPAPECSSACPDGDCIEGDTITKRCGMPQGRGDTLTLFLPVDTTRVDYSGSCLSPEYEDRGMIKIKYDWVRCDNIWLLRSQSLNGDANFPACITEPPSGGGVFTDIIDAYTCWNAGGCNESSEDVYFDAQAMPGFRCNIGNNRTVGEELSGSAGSYGSLYYRSATQYYGSNHSDNSVYDQYCCTQNPSLVPSDCWTKGMTRYQLSAAEEHYLWAHEIWNFNGGADLTFLTQYMDEWGVVSTTPRPLWKEFLGFTFKENYYKCDISCVELPVDYPPATPPCHPTQSRMTCTNPDLYRIAPKYLISGCSGVPVFQYQLVELQLAGHIASWQDVVVSWRKLEQMYYGVDEEDPFTQEDIERVRTALNALMTYGEGKAQDWRGWIFDTIDADHKPCVESPAEVGEDQSINLTFGVALRRNKAFDLVPDPVVSTAADLQAVACVREELAGLDSKGTIMFRAMSGGMSFAHWLIDRPPTTATTDGGAWNNWWDRQIAPAHLRVVGHSEIYTPFSGEFAWCPRGDPRQVVGGGFSPYPASYNCASGICDTWGFAPSIPLYGHAGYAAGRFSMVAMHSEYGYKEGTDYCGKVISHYTWARSPDRVSVWDSSVVPFVERAREVSDPPDGVDAVDTRKRHHPPCHACQAVVTLAPNTVLAIGGRCESREFSELAPNFDFTGDIYNTNQLTIGTDASITCS